MMAYAWVLPALCLLAFLLLETIGKRVGLVGAWVAVLAVASGFVLFWGMLADFLARGSLDSWLTWMQIGARVLRVGTLVDPLALLMVFVVTTCATLIQVYSIGYMRRDPRFGWFFAVMLLF